jgi:Rab-GTPase-TBC domain
MNEIFVPFLLMMRNGISIEQAYIMAKRFIDICLVSMFKDDVIPNQTFRPVQAMFLITKILLRYNNPTLCNALGKLSITPELYATSWYLTLFATKISKIENIFYLWKEILTEKDTVFPCYLGIAFLEYYQAQIQNSPYPNLAQAISKTSITSLNGLQSILTIARRIKGSMPLSWKFKLMEYDIFNLQTIDTVISSLVKEPSLLIYPREIIQRSYPELQCSCKNSCLWCEERKLQPMIVLDCRPEIEKQAGYLPNTHLTDNKLYYNSEFIDSYIDRFQDIKGLYHIVLLGSADFYSKGFELNSVENPSSSQEMIEFVYLNLFNKGFAFVSIAEGGFKRCHELAGRFNLEIRDHLPGYCFVCTPKGPRYGSKVKFNLQKFTKSMSDVLKFTMTKVATGFSSFSTTDPIKNSQSPEYSNSMPYICRKFDKTTNNKSDEEFSLLVMKDEVVLGRYAEHQPKNIIKVLDNIKMEDLLKITSMKKFPSVLTFFTISTQLCVILETVNDAKDCIGLVTKYFRELKTKA